MIISGRVDFNEIDRMNRLLIDHYGIGPSDKPHFRIVWGGDQFEKRVMTHTDEGLELVRPEIREVYKYWKDLRNKYILESLTVVPEWAETDLVEKLSYEPKWVFEDKHGNALYPRWDAIKFVLETVRANVEERRGPYKDPEAEPEQRKERVDAVQQDLFGDDTAITDALHYGSGIVVPGQGES